ncbi:hypothetical protein QQP08_022068 [Theobroma cacao]|nr:hypothetical protein QQP08_022068 [Theobroma cacao]
MAGEPAGMTCILELDTDIPGWHITMIKLFKSIQDVSYTIDAQAKLAHVSGKIDKELLLKLLAKAKTHALTHQINYGIDLPKPVSEPIMVTKLHISLQLPFSSSVKSLRVHNFLQKSVLLVDTDIPGWHKTMCLLFKSMQGVTLRIDSFTKQAYISGKISPQLQLKLLAKAEAQAARLCWLQYGCETDPYGRPVHKESEANDTSSSNPAPSSKPKFYCFWGVCFLQNCILRVDTQLVGWHAMLVRVLSSIDGITYNIDEEKGVVQITGRINPTQLMRTLAEIGLHADLSWVDSGYREMNIPSRHGYDYSYHGSYGCNPYGRPGHNYGYPHQQRTWHLIYENYPYYSHYHEHYPYYEPQAQHFPQPPPPPEGFRNGDPEWCSIM